jgi:hypothetical protein
MNEIELGSAGITEEDISRSAPLVRALAVQRLELIWRNCEPHIDLSPDDLELGRKPDPRFIEAGIRVVDRLTALYGLLKPVASGEGVTNEGIEATRQNAITAIEALEAKIREE